MEKFDLAVINGNLVVPDEGIYGLNVYVKDGKVAAISDSVYEASETVDASGKYVAPGIIDPHVHIGTNCDVETDMTPETRAALIGGVTTVCSFFGGNGSFLDTLPEVKRLTNSMSYVDVLPLPAIQTDRQLEELPATIAMGVRSYKVYMNGILGMVPWRRDDFILKVAEALKDSGEQCTLSCHCENGDMIEFLERKARKEHPDDMNIVDFGDIHPALAEAEAVYRFAAIGELFKLPVYIVHLVRARSVELLREIRRYNPYVSVETTSPYLTLNRYCAQGNYLKMKPPVQDPCDSEGLWQGIRDGVIDTIGTDNTSNTMAEKNLSAENFWDITPGYEATQWHLTASFSEGVNKRNIPVERLMACMSKNPAQKYGIYPQKGCLEPGSDADIVIIDPELIKTATCRDNQSRSDYCIYEGMEFKGWPVMTIKSGHITVKDGTLVGEKRYGKFLSF